MNANSSAINANLASIATYLVNNKGLSQISREIGDLMQQVQQVSIQKGVVTSNKRCNWRFR
jgi:hypothetical protein